MHHDMAGWNHTHPHYLRQDRGRMRGKAGKTDRGDEGGKGKAERRRHGKLKMEGHRDAEIPMADFFVSVGKHVVKGSPAVLTTPN